MLRFAANLSLLFTELPFRARFAAARMAGFRGVEMLFPYELEAGELRAELEANDLELVLFNTPAGDWEAGDRGLAALPGQETAFEAALDKALDYAEITSCTRVHAMAGALPVTADGDDAMRTFVGNLMKGAEAARARGVTLLIEPINRRDMPGYFLSRTETARRVIEMVGADNLGLQLDLYHRQTMQGDLSAAIRENMDITRHIQVANLPGRTDPGHGEIDYGHIFDTIEDCGYAGWIGCEYKPIGRTLDSLAWLERRRGARKRGT